MLDYIFSYLNLCNLLLIWPIFFSSFLQWGMKNVVILLISSTKITRSSFHCISEDSCWSGITTWRCQTPLSFMSSVRLSPTLPSHPPGPHCSMEANTTHISKRNQFGNNPLLWVLLDWCRSLKLNFS